MHNHSASVVLLTLSLLSYCCFSHSAPLSRKNDANANVFKLLLGLYKINPLKGSPVYKSFSENLLMGTGRNGSNKLVWNGESGESVKVKEKVKTKINEIENIIHKKTKKPVNLFDKPAYDLDDVSTENFKADFVINNQVLSKEEIQKVLLDSHNTHNIRENFSALFEHIGSNEIDTDLPVTKLLPTKNTVTRYSQVSNQNGAVFSQLTDGTNHIEVPMDNLLEETKDVIVL